MSEQALSLPATAAAGVFPPARRRLARRVSLARQRSADRLALGARRQSDRQVDGDALTSVARLTGLLSAYLALVQVLLLARTARLRGYQAMTILSDGRVLATPGFPG
jgi:hypothetical protein